MTLLGNVDCKTCQTEVDSHQSQGKRDCRSLKLGYMAMFGDAPQHSISIFWLHKVYITTIAIYTARCSNMRSFTSNGTSVNLLFLSQHVHIITFGPILLTSTIISRDLCIPLVSIQTKNQSDHLLYREDCCNCFYYACFSSTG